MSTLTVKTYDKTYDKLRNTYTVLFILSKMVLAIDVLKYRAIEGYTHLAKTVLLTPLCSTKKTVSNEAAFFLTYSTVTDLARFFGLSISHPFSFAT